MFTHCPRCGSHDYNAPNTTTPFNEFEVPLTTEDRTYISLRFSGILCRGCQEAMRMERIRSLESRYVA